MLFLSQIIIVQITCNNLSGHEYLNRQVNIYLPRSNHLDKSQHWLRDVSFAHLRIIDVPYTYPYSKFRVMQKHCLSDVRVIHSCCARAVSVIELQKTGLLKFKCPFENPGETCGLRERGDRWRKPKESSAYRYQPTNTYVIATGTDAAQRIIMLNYSWPRNRRQRERE